MVSYVKHSIIIIFVVLLSVFFVSLSHSYFVLSVVAVLYSSCLSLALPREMPSSVLYAASDLELLPTHWD